MITTLEEGVAEGGRGHAIVTWSVCTVVSPATTCRADTNAEVKKDASREEDGTVASREATYSVS
jgi:hypothetical protein